MCKNNNINDLLIDAKDKSNIFNKSISKMNRKENIFLAKKLFTELVFNTAYIEGVNVTFPQTQTIIDGGVVNLAVSDIQTVLNLRDAWKFMINNIDEPFNLNYVCKINEYVSRNESLDWGVLRYSEVGVSGTTYIPAIPIKENVEQEINNINKIENALEKALDFFCYSVRNQLFWDGNKRTATIVSNKILIEAGAGVLTIGQSNALEFNEALNHYYNTNDNKKLKQVLQNSIRTLNLSKYNTIEK